MSALPSVVKHVHTEQQCDSKRQEAVLSRAWMTACSKRRCGCFQ